ncbi:MULTISPECIES: CHAT domain-containing protein [Cyanophyceae]|uniref:CHAT domain-containing protein n=1 Tax=Cyanophyceae TaxID=3028117 RepID=UPI001683D590|nr:CHAT domain-containing protein [Trichocoleus sp. FACHB-69]MBD1932046.1 CHAT domain-containing protein [Trichocoleus sp. FACHB-69]
MLTLRLTQHADSQPAYYRVEVALKGDGSRQTATVRFQFKLTQQEQENIRWYLEDYLQYLSDPAPQIAAKVERRMAEIGVELFKEIFQANDDARDLWATLRQNLNHTRVEILTDIAQATAIPWELLRDPKTDACLALRSPAFVRSYSQPAQRPRLPQTNGDTIRILLVICRPQGRDDVPFRSVASRLIKGLGTRTDGFQLDVLRPPTFEQLSRVLRQAKAQGKPYHVVHFDGHGVYQDSSQLTLNKNPLFFADRRPGMHGYLAFENGMADENVEFVSGSDLGQLLVETDVPVLVLNACRSGHAEAQDAPTQIEGATSDQIGDAHSPVRSFGSLAQEVMDAGVAGVVAMRYNLYVMTAAQFVADLYASLVQGQTLGEAVTSGRKQLKDQPQREVAYKPVALQDWLVPVVYEAAAITLFPAPVHSQKLTIQLHENDALPVTGMLDAQLPKAPDAGFFGRDETLLAIDRAFDHHAIILLHAFAGSGKTSTAAEFGRWYALTGGLLEAGKQGYVLFTSFQRYLPLSRVLDKLGQVFERDLERSGIQWLALSDEQQRAVALQVLSQVPVLWIWDNVEPVAGFPDGETQRWSEAEQQELADFLRDARDTKAKFLLTSRRDERGWLGDLPVRVQVLPMPMQERVQFARALAKKHGHRLTNVEDWRPLLRYTQGNPLTITVVVGQALRNGYRSKEQIEKFVADLQSGEAELDDDESDGRAKSLSASLSYGFEHNFTLKEKERLALLSFFQGFVTAFVFSTIGYPDNEWRTPKVADFEEFYRTAISILKRATEIGFLQEIEVDFYWIHPALPWYFNRLFRQLYALKETRLSATYAFVRAIGDWGTGYHNLYFDGNRDVAAFLIAEELNLLYALKLAIVNNWKKELNDVARGLFALYEHIGDRSQEESLTVKLLPYFVDSKTREPILNLEEEWDRLTHHYFKLLLHHGRMEEAKQLQQKKVEWNRKQTQTIINLSPEELDETQKIDIRNLAVSIEGIGVIFRSQNNPECVGYFEEAVSLYQKISNRTAEAVVAHNLAQAYKDISEIQNYTEAQEWLLKAFQLYGENDFLGKGKSAILFGKVCHERFEKARPFGEEKALLRELNLGIEFYHKALKSLPSNAVADLVEASIGLGDTYSDAVEFELALSYYQQAIRYSEEIGNFYKAAQARYSAAITLARAERYDDALFYAQAALRTVETCGINEKIQPTKDLISNLEQKLLERSGLS